MSKGISVDPYDDIPVGLTRRGAHRAPVSARNSLIKLAWAALATGFLVTLGLGGLVVMSDSVSLKDFTTIFAGPTTAPTQAPRPTAAPTVDPSLLVNVLNATATSGLATTVATTLAEAGWQVGSKTNASSQVANTVVYYGSPNLEGAARGVLQSLGVGTIELTDAYIDTSAQLTVVLGADFLTPAPVLPTPAAT